ncbi:MAG TPA: GNAT family N-acetyltransferase [Pedobacter sp.]|jgi:phosphinothricin acetyltransferase
MKIISCDFSYANQILDIFNDAILNSTALYDYQPRTMENMKTWFESKADKNYPIIGVIDEQDQLMGFGTYGMFRERPAYKYTVEHSLYIHKNFRGQGLGKIILREIIDNATNQNYHCLVAGIDSTNEASIKLHKIFGFEFCGKMKQVGYKFSKWLDLEFYQLILETPVIPNEE